MTPLPTRCRTHSENMWSEGWYTTSNVLEEAATRIEELELALCKHLGHDWSPLNPHRERCMRCGREK